MISVGASIDQVDRTGMTALMHATRAGNKELVRLLLRARAALNIQDDSGWTALMWACLYGRTRIALDLIRDGADVECRGNDEETTALGISEWNKRKKIVTALLEEGARPVTSRRRGNTNITTDLNHQRFTQQSS